MHQAPMGLHRHRVPNVLGKGSFDVSIRTTFFLQLGNSIIAVEFSPFLRGRIGLRIADALPEKPR